MNTEKIQVTATINADNKKVWDFYTLPEHITQWNFADPSWQCPNAENELRVGGKYKARMEARDGSYGFDFEAMYTEVIPGKKFSYEMPDGRKATVIFKGTDDKTEVVVTFDPENENPIELQKNGWQAILKSFKNYTETN